jgi:hypothetical protein
LSPSACATPRSREALDQRTDGQAHLNTIFRKLGIRDRVELTLYAARAGIISLKERSA